MNEWKERKFRTYENKKSNIYKNKKVAKIDDIDVNKILLSKEKLYGKKIHLNTLLDHYA